MSVEEVDEFRMKQRFINMFMTIAETVSHQSSAKRLKVGSIIVKDDRVISIGYNGTPAGWDNCCEEVIEQHEDGGQLTKTKDEVIHAEANAIAKLARSSESGLDATMFITHAPCIQCAKIIYGAGIKDVFYKYKYRDDEGLNFLNKCNIKTEQV